MLDSITEMDGKEYTTVKSTNVVIWLPAVEDDEYGSEARRDEGAALGFILLTIIEHNLAIVPSQSTSCA
jgi:hypothetical protein